MIVVILVCKVPLETLDQGENQALLVPLVPQDQRALREKLVQQVSLENVVTEVKLVKLELLAQMDREEVQGKQELLGPRGQEAKLD